MADVKITKKLKMGFNNSAGRRHYWTPKTINEGIAHERVDELMVKMTTLGMFEKDGIQLFQEAVSARFIETHETEFFDHSKDGVLQARRAEKALIEEKKRLKSA